MHASVGGDCIRVGRPGGEDPCEPSWRLATIGCLPLSCLTLCPQSAGHRVNAPEILLKGINGLTIVSSEAVLTLLVPVRFLPFVD